MARLGLDDVAHGLERWRRRWRRRQRRFLASDSCRGKRRLCWSGVWRPFWKCRHGSSDSAGGLGLGTSHRYRARPTSHVEWFFFMDYNASAWRS